MKNILLCRQYKQKWTANFAVWILDLFYSTANDCYSLTQLPNGKYYIQHDT